MATNKYGVSFNGRRITHPGGYASIDASGMTVTTGGSVNIPIVVGTADAGESGVVKWFTSADEAKKYLQGGDLPTALDMMFSPAPEGGGGASIIGIIVANQTKQASMTSDGTTVTSKEFGEGGNRIQVKMEDGTIPGTKKVTVFRWDTDEVEVHTDLGAVMAIEYSGDSVYAVATVTEKDNVKTLDIKLGADEQTAQIDISLPLGNDRFQTVDDVIKHLNSLSGYMASYVSYKSSTMPVELLDVTTSPVNIKTKGYVMGVGGDISHQITNYSELIEVKITGEIKNFPNTYLTGGSKGTAPSTWSKYFGILKNEFSDMLIVLSPLESIHAEALAHVQQMEQRHQNQMLFTGGDINESISMVKQRAFTLNSSRAVLAYPGIYHRSVSNGKKPLAPYFTAALIAGRVAGVDVSEPVTFDYFNLVSLEKGLLAGDPEIDDLLNAGVAVMERVQNGGIRLVQGITTYTGSNNTLYREISVRRGADHLSSIMRSTLEETFVGKKGLKATVSAVTTKVIDVLKQAVMDGTITAFRNIVVRFVDTVVYVDYEVAPVEPINFILITSHFVPDSVMENNE